MGILNTVDINVYDQEQICLCLYRYLNAAAIPNVDLTRLQMRHVEHVIHLSISFPLNISLLKQLILVLVIIENSRNYLSAII